MKRTITIGLLLGLAVMLAVISISRYRVEAQTTWSCDAVCQALISTPGYSFAPAVAPIVAGELQGLAVISAAQNAQVALLQSRISALERAQAQMPAAPAMMTICHMFAGWFPSLNLVCASS